MAVVSNLKDIRKSHHQTQKEVAYAIGVDTKTIRNIEVNGACSLENALRLAAYYELTVNALFNASDLPPAMAKEP